MTLSLGSSSALNVEFDDHVDIRGSARAWPAEAAGRMPSWMRLYACARDGADPDQ
jgi:hypothetical protein